MKLLNAAGRSIFSRQGPLALLLASPSAAVQRSSFTLFPLRPTYVFLSFAFRRLTAPYGLFSPREKGDSCTPLSHRAWRTAARLYLLLSRRNPLGPQKRRRKNTTLLKVRLSVKQVERDTWHAHHTGRLSNAAGTLQRHVYFRRRIAHRVSDTIFTINSV